MTRTKNYTLCCLIPALLFAALAAGAEQAKPVPQMNYGLVEANNEFGFYLFYDRVVNRMFENVLISPLSAAMALAMAENGARGVTREAISTALAQGELTLEQINMGSMALLDQTSTADPVVTLSIANSLWAGDPVGLRQEFVETCRQYYRAEVKQVEFGNPDAVKAVNDWVSSATQGLIRDIVTELSPDDVLLLANAVFFKGQWQTSFDAELTEDRSFYGLDSTFQTPMMQQAGEYRYLESQDGFQAVELPYGGGRFAMYVFLPDSALGMLGFCDFLNAGNWADWVAGFFPARGEVVLPRFTLEHEENLNEALAHLGMGVAFDPDKADFSVLADSTEQVYISEVKHKAFVEVNEEGTQAAAATSVVIEAKGPSRAPFRMVLDHPFFFAIRDNGTGSLLFLGAVYEPRP